MIVNVCDGCGEEIAEDDDFQRTDRVPAFGGDDIYHWCGDCVRGAEEERKTWPASM